MLDMLRTIMGDDDVICCSDMVEVRYNWKTFGWLGEDDEGLKCRGEEIFRLEFWRV